MGGVGTRNTRSYILYIYIDSDGAAKLGDKASVKRSKCVTTGKQKMGSS